MYILSPTIRFFNTWWEYLVFTKHNDIRGFFRKKRYLITFNIYVEGCATTTTMLVCDEDFIWPLYKQLIQIL